MSITPAEVLLRLQEIFDDIFLDEIVVTAELSAKDVEEWDSLLHISLVVMIEEKFGISFRVGEVEGTRNVGDFANLIVKRFEEKNG